LAEALAHVAVVGNGSEIMDDEPVEVEVEVDGIKVTVQASQTETGWIVNVEGTEHHVNAERASQATQRSSKRKKKRSMSGGTITSSMPGSIVEISVKEGQEVVEGDLILILEAMKMQNEMRTPIAGKVTEIACSVGENVEANRTLVIITPLEQT